MIFNYTYENRHKKQDTEEISFSPVRHNRKQNLTATELDLNTLMPKHLIVRLSVKLVSF